MDNSMKVIISLLSDRVL